MVAVVNIAAALHGRNDLALHLLTDHITALGHGLHADIAHKSDLVAEFFFQFSNIQAGVSLQRLQHIQPHIDQVRNEIQHVAATVHDGLQASLMSEVHNLFVPGLQIFSVMLQGEQGRTGATHIFHDPETVNLHAQTQSIINGL